MMMTKRKIQRKFPARKGAALLVVLGVIMVITIVALAYISRSDGELQYGQNMLLRTQADYLAESGLEHARGLVLNPQEVSGEYWMGATSQQIDSGDFYYDVSVEPNAAYSGPTRWCNYDISCRAYRLTGGERTAQSNFNALLRLNPCVAYWSDTAADRQLSSAVTINGDVYCRGNTTNYGLIEGDAFGALTGPVTGQVTDSNKLTLQWPDVNIAGFYAKYTFEPVSSPLSGPVSAPYVKCDGDLTIADDVQINGMLIVDGDLRISGTGNLIRANKALPALLVTGDLTIEENAKVDIEGLAVVEGAVNVSVGCEDVNVLGGLFASGGMVETVRDSANGLNAIIHGEPSWTSGQVGKAAQFNGTNEYLEVGQESPFDISERITVAAWIKVGAFDRNYQAIVTKGDTAWRIQRYLNTNKIEFACSGLSYNAPSGNIIGNKSVNDGQWHHVAGVYDGSRIHLYIDGQVDRSQASSGTINKNNYKVMIGENAQQQGRCWNGLIDDVRIYNRALDPNEILQVKDGLGSTSGLIAHWKLDEDGQRQVVVTAAPAKTAIWCWSASGTRQKWAQAAGAFYKAIRRN